MFSTVLAAVIAVFASMAFPVKMTCRRRNLYRCYLDHQPGSLFGISDDISMQVVAVGFIIGVIQDSVETALNSSSDLLLSASAEFRQWRLEGKEIKF